MRKSFPTVFGFLVFDVFSFFYIFVDGFGWPGPERGRGSRCTTTPADALEYNVFKSNLIAHSCPSTSPAAQGSENP